MTKEITPEMFKGGPDATTIADVEGHPGCVMLVAPTGEVMFMPLSQVEEMFGDLEQFRYVGSHPPV